MVVCNPDTITVTSSADSGAGTLRQAIADACAGETIDFDSALSGTTIYLSSTLTLTKNVTIDGSSLASQITISGDSDNNGSGNVRVVFVNGAVNIVLDSLTITKGLASGTTGGGIRNDGTLTIRDSTITGNAASFGGGIQNNWQLTVLNSTISNNSANIHGGGVLNFGGVMDITNSTISGNTVSSNGGGIAQLEGASAPTSTLTNVTISGNSASSQGGGIHTFSGTLNYTNTIVANSTGGDCTMSGGSIGTNINNLVENASCSTSLSGDPNLGALASNGGPTQTFALLDGSPAIDAGNNVTCAASPVSGLDQRGFNRPNGASCDIGAYEYNHPPVVSSIVRTGASPNNAASVNFTVTFSESVTGVDSTDFNLTTSGITGASVSGVTGSGATRTVSVNTGSGEGTLRLDVLNDDSIQDNLGKSLSGGFTSGESYTIDNIIPSVSSSVRTNANPTNAASVNYTVTFSESVTGVDVSDFSLLTSGGSDAYVTGVTGSGTTYTVSISTGSASTTLRLDVIDDGIITDLAGNTLSGDFTSGESYTYDISGPTVVSSIRANTSPINATSVSLTVTFSESVSGVDTTDFGLTTSGVTGASITGVAGSGSTYMVTVNTGSGSGTIRLNVFVDGSILDAAGNTLAGSFTTGETYLIDKTAPTVVSSIRANTSPTNATSVSFTVAFSESVSGVDTTDFGLTTTGVSGASITGVAGSGSTYTVTVNTGSGSGTIRLNVFVDGSILDAAGNTLAGSFTSGETYTITKSVTLTIISTNTQDGWVLESSESSNKGSKLNSTATTLRLGDDATKKQYRSILSFNTASIPDSAVITAVILKVKRQGVTGGGNPLSMFQGFMVDIKKGLFGAANLQTADFQTATSKTYGPFSPSLANGWYSINLTNGKAYINKLSSSAGRTQIRLRFKLDDNNNAIANYLSLFSGNAAAASRPQLVITYTIP